MWGGGVGKFIEILTVGICDFLSNNIYVYNIVRSHRRKSTNIALDNFWQIFQRLPFLHLLPKMVTVGKSL